MTNFRTAKFFRNQHAHQAERAHSLVHIFRKTAAAIPFGCVGSQLASRKITRHIANHPLFFGQKQLAVCWHYGISN